MSQQYSIIINGKRIYLNSNQVFCPVKLIRYSCSSFNCGNLAHDNIEKSYCPYDFYNGAICSNMSCKAKHMYEIICGNYYADDDHIRGCNYMHDSDTLNGKFNKVLYYSLRQDRHRHGYEMIKLIQKEQSR